MRLQTSAVATLTLFLGFACAAEHESASAATQASSAPFQLDFQPVDAETAQELEPVLREAVRTVETWFGAPFPVPFTITLQPDRAAFDASFPPEWGVAHTECWMVASGVATGVQLLSPRVWKAQACEHDPADARHVAQLLTHELVHVYHGQHNPSPDFVDTNGIDWFAEGLATLASGQLASEHAGHAREALASGLGPTSLATAWTGRYRYGVSGSLVAFVEHERGRAVVIQMLGASSGEELLELAGMSEAELLERWRAAVRTE
ncbi:MAG: hypothetical protein EXS08_15350 [Planctomycetes bacterium]|nr:hypothetical protein [Planctomycetota bacterium]